MSFCNVCLVSPEALEPLVALSLELNLLNAAVLRMDGVRLCLDAPHH